MDAEAMRDQPFLMLRKAERLSTRHARSATARQAKRRGPGAKPQALRGQTPPAGIRRFNPSRRIAAEESLIVHRCYNDPQPRSWTTRDGVNGIIGVLIADDAVPLPTRTLPTKPSECNKYTRLLSISAKL